MERYFQAILTELGEDTQRDDLQDTPRRAADALRHLTNGYQGSLADVVANGIFPCQQSGLVLVKDIECYSLCEHHLLPFMGRCHVAYLPNDQVLGLSKIASIVELYARRLQIQERLTQQIAEAINATLAPHGVAVIIEAQHLCMMMRGVEKQQATVTTSVMLGEFDTNPQLRLELLTAVK